MWKTKDGYTLTMPQSELEALAAELSGGGGCGCKGCAISAVTQELDHLISQTRRVPRHRSAAHKGRSARPAARARARGGSHTRPRSDTFAGQSARGNYQFHTRTLPGRRRWIYAYTPPPWAAPQPPLASADCAPDDPSCAQPAPGAAPDAAAAPPDDGAAPAGDAGELSGTVLGAILRGG